MEQAWFTAAFWLALGGTEALGARASWITVLAGSGAIVLTFLAGAELDPSVFRAKWKEAVAVGLVGFLGPFLAAAAMGGLAVWAGSEAVLPAYVIGMVLAGGVGRDHVLVRRLRTLTFGLLTPFYFIRAGSLVSVTALAAAPAVLLVLLMAKMTGKLALLIPTVRSFNYPGREGPYYSFMMSTGLTFGTISALFGLNHNIIDQWQYSHLAATVVGSAVAPTVIANAWFLPRHLMPARLSQRERPALTSRVEETA